MSIEANITARRAEEAKRRNTKDAVLLILEAATGLLSEVDVKMFWTGLAVASLDRAGIPQEEPAPPPAPRYEPMTDDEARRFGRQLNMCNPHRLVPFNDCPHDFLSWLDSVRFPEAIALHRYVESDFFQREVPDDGD